MSNEEKYLLVEESIAPDIFKKEPSFPRSGISDRFPFQVIEYTQIPIGNGHRFEGCHRDIFHPGSPGKYVYNCLSFLAIDIIFEKNNISDATNL